jgi:signal transduction histidine kinase
VQTPPSPTVDDKPDSRAPADRTALAASLERHVEEITRQWEAEVGSSSSALRASLGEYLLGLAAALRRGVEPLQAAALAWQSVSTRHRLSGAGRLPLEQVIAQLAALRRAINVVAPDAQHDLIADLIDATVAQAASSYIHQRDREARQVRADHIGFVTHELRNPLTAAMVAASRLRPEDPQTEWAPAAALVQRSLKRVSALIETFLAAERFDAEQIHPHTVDVLIGEIVGSATVTAERVAHRPEVLVSTTLDPVVVVRVDPTLTIAALQNVITNALQCSDKGTVTVASEERGDRLILHVRDNCEGISPEAAARMFEPFFGSHPGKVIPGLGLALARRVMEEQGGSIDVETEPGGGCHFLIVLPRSIPLTKEAHGAHLDHR